ncbi:hypothetical protein AGDE_03516 [Angomonas deanei]|uniref:LSM domain containing protein, putative n=1 Tax=Angomonas deanei TaxID=59799 RepID=A0A7G2CPY0_9TRYP|nr:hypothetical protein AGDE_03516 [Angomonas deanei]CAD2221167.1 LSM domain containing protein, putative [Angomonas deanei]|eukprot:EPY40412.1 hypothetical protein AGDE_03516 [Angomonas deanei]
MSLNLESILRKPCSCYTAESEVVVGSLTAIDGVFNVVLTNKEKEEQTFVRGENVVYVAFGVRE